MIFVADSKFHHAIHELGCRGWTRHNSVTFPFADLIWRNYRHIVWHRLRPNQVVNHLQDSILLSKKSTFSLLLRNGSTISDQYFPRCFYLRDEQAVMEFLGGSVQPVNGLLLRNSSLIYRRVYT